MEDLENEYDRGVYWVIFFIGLILIAIIGHRFVFELDSDENVNEEENEVVEENYDSYKGVWQLFGDDELPEQELAINIIDGSTITFDYAVRDVDRFESQTASLENDKARFEIVNDDDEKLVGKMVFKNDKIFLTITSSTIDGITVGTIEFSEKGEESLLD